MVRGLGALHSFVVCSVETRQLSGLALQLCVELGYHRKQDRPEADPLVAEVQKRFFWAAYGYDR